MFKIVAVADQIKERRDDAVEFYGARVYEDYSELLKDGDFDLFVNALPSPLHVSVSIEAMDLGFDVICEKPLSKQASDMDLLMAAAERNNVFFGPFQQGRFQPFFKKILEVIDSGVLGDIINVRSNWSNFARRWDWQTLQKNLGGALLNTGPHAVDQALCILGEEKEINKDINVFCKMSCHNVFEGDAEDFCTLILHGANIPTYEINITGYSAHPATRYTVRGRFGGLEGNERELNWRYFDPAEAPKQEMWGWSVDRKYPQETLPWKEEKWIMGEEDLSKATGYTQVSVPSAPEAYYRNVYSTLFEGDSMLVTHNIVKKQLQIMEEAHRQNSPLIKQ